MRLITLVPFLFVVACGSSGSSSDVFVGTSAGSGGTAGAGGDSGGSSSHHGEQGGTGATGGDATAGTSAAGSGGGSSGGASTGGSVSSGGSGNSGNATGGNASGGAPATGGQQGGGGAASGSGGFGGGACPTWCRDEDSDDYGNPLNSQVSCAEPAGWVADCSDCDDTNGNVHPGADCQTTPYLLGDGVTMSFDYDCSTQETECSDTIKAANACGVVGPLSCGGGGYLPNPDRTAAIAQNTYCGSTVGRNCVSVGLPCVAQAVTMPAIGCH